MQVVFEVLVKGLDLNLKLAKLDNFPFKSELFPKTELSCFKDLKITRLYKTYNRSVCG
jgi:hypothetical protein